MGHLFVTPEWFYMYSVILEVFFAIITLMVSYYAYKIYKLTEERQSKLFSLAFLFIAVSYIIQSSLNFIILNKMDSDLSMIINLKAVYLLNLFGTYAHALLFIIGLIILTYITLKVKNAKVLTLLLSIVILSVIFSANKIFLFYVISSVLLLHTVIYYFTNYINNKKVNTLIVLVAMIFLLFSTLHFMFAIQYEIYYVIGHVLEAIAYLLILSNLILIWKHGEKKR